MLVFSSTVLPAPSPYHKAVYYITIIIVILYLPPTASDSFSDSAGQCSTLHRRRTRSAWWCTSISSGCTTPCSTGCGKAEEQAGATVCQEHSVSDSFHCTTVTTQLRYSTTAEFLIMTTLVVQVEQFVQCVCFKTILTQCWLCGPAVEHRSLAGVLSLSCARLVADGWPLMWVSYPL